METRFSKKAEIIKNVIHTLPVRRSQAANWAIRLLNIKNNFIGNFLGKKMEVHPLDASSRSAYFLGFYERETTLWTLDYVKKNKPSIVFDIGAHFGYFMYLCTLNELRPTVYAFEPDPYNQDWLNRNIQLNNLETHIKIIDKAVSHSPGKVSFEPSSPESGETLWAKIDSKANNNNSIEVDTVSLDEFCAANNINSVDLIKMDIEGAEGFAIDGMMKGISNKIYKNVLLELHPDLLSNEHAPEKLIQRFTDNGYKVYRFEQSYQNKNIDKILGTYDLVWKDKYMTEYNPSKKISGWEHFLFTVE